MIFVTEADYVDAYRIRLAFSDDSKGIVDLSDVIRLDHREIFNELTDIDKFKQFQVDADTIVWENGLDLAPEFLHQRLQ